LAISAGSAASGGGTGRLCDGTGEVEEHRFFDTLAAPAERQSHEGLDVGLLLVDRGAQWRRRRIILD
jgi:hypothetical protein